MKRVDIDDYPFCNSNINFVRVKEWVDSVYFKINLNIDCSFAYTLGNGVHITFKFDDKMYFDIIQFVKNLDEVNFSKPYVAFMNYKDLHLRAVTTEHHEALFG